MITLSPRASNRSVRWEPMKPAPPVMKTFMLPRSGELISNPGQVTPKGGALDDIQVLRNDRALAVIGHKSLIRRFRPLPPIAGVVLQPAHGRSNSAPVVKSSPSRPVHDFRKRADPSSNDRGRLFERFDQDDAERPETDRRYDERDRMLVVTPKLIGRHAPEEPHVIDPGGRDLEGRRIFTVARDEQVSVRIIPEQGNDVIEPLDLFQPPDEQKIGPRCGASPPTAAPTGSGRAESKAALPSAS